MKKLVFRGSLESDRILQKILENKLENERLIEKLIPEFEPVEAEEDEVEVTQYLRPSGEKLKKIAKVGIEVAKRAKGLVLSAEILTTGMIVIYARRKGECEETERSVLAENEPEKNSLTNKLIELINSFKGEK